MKTKKIFIPIILMLLLVSSVLGATIPSRYTLDFYNVNGIQRLTHVNTTQLNVGNGTSVGNINTSNGNVNFNLPTGSIMVNGVLVCLSNGTSCSASGGSDGTGGWTNTSTITSTTRNVGIGTVAPESQLDLVLSSTSESFNLVNNLTSAFVGSFKFKKFGNSTTSMGTAAGGDELGNFDMWAWNGTALRRTGLIQFQASNSHGSTNMGTSLVFYNSPRNDLTLRLAMAIQGQGVYIGNNTAITNPTHRLTVDGIANVTALTMNNYAYPACTGSVAGMIAYNTTLNKHVGCNSTAWNNLY